MEGKYIRSDEANRFSLANCSLGNYHEFRKSTDLPVWAGFYVAIDMAAEDPNAQLEGFC